MATTPHWYSHRDQWSEGFDEAVLAIREFGYPAVFRGQTYRYFDANGFTYWTMGAPVEQTILINRAATEPPRRRYDEIAEIYDDLFSAQHFRAEDRALRARIGALPGPITDIGAGTGAGIDVLRASPLNYLGVEPSPRMVEVARQRHAGYHFLTCSARSFYPREAPGSIVSLYGSMSYVDPETRDYLRGLIRPGGRIFWMYYAPGYTPITHQHLSEPPPVFDPPDGLPSWGNYLIEER